MRSWLTRSYTATAAPARSTSTTHRRTTALRSTACASGGTSRRHPRSPTSVTSSPRPSGATSARGTTPGSATWSGRTAAPTAWTCAATPTWSASGSGRPSVRSTRRFPDLAAPFDHAADACFGPMVGLFDGALPDDVRARLLAFPGPHEVAVGVPGEWSATSWLTDDVMAGAHAGSPVRMGGHQLVPVTVHWAARVDQGAQPARRRRRRGGARPDRGHGARTRAGGAHGRRSRTRSREPSRPSGGRSQDLDVTLQTAGATGPPRVTANGVALDLPPGPFRLDVEPT